MPEIPFEKKELAITIHNPNNLPVIDFHELKELQGDLKITTPAKIEKLKNSIIKYGIFVPKFVWIDNNTYYIEDGHQTIKALTELEKGGYNVPPIPYVEIQAKNRKDAGEKLLMINSRFADINSETSFFKDFDIGLEFMDEIEIPELELDFEDVNEEIIEDEVPEVPEEPVTRVGDLWLCGKHRVLCGDATKAEDVERLMDSEKAEILFTSPPYFDLREYENNSNLDVSHIIGFIGLFYPYTNYLIINLGLKRKDNEIIEYWQKYIQTAKRAGYKFLSWNVWDRLEAGGIGNQTAMFEIDHEWLFIFGTSFKSLNRFIAHSENTKDRYEYGASTRRLKDGTLKDIELTKTHKKKQLGTVQRIRLLKTRTEDNIHPAMFPVELPAEYIEAMTQENDILCDPFLGSGTTLIAADQLNRICYGMEIEPKYVDVSCQRFLNLTGADPVRELDGKKWSELQQK